MRLLIITAVEAEARAIGSIDGVIIVVAGIGRTNAAAATTETILRNQGRIDAVLNAGIAGALPSSNAPAIGDVVVASSCVYVEEGLITPNGFIGMDGMGFALGDFAGNGVPVDLSLLELLGNHFRIGPIATVATCSGTDAAAAEVVHRTGAVAEAMEGAAVVHAARRLKIPAIELRAISNTTGDRSKQRWDLPRSLQSLATAVKHAVAIITRRV